MQDNFRVRSNLTLELGIRYDLNVSPTEADDRFVYFDPASVSLQQVGQGVRDKIYGNKNNWQPRIGVVWDPVGDGRTAVRAAYALLRRPAGDEPGDAHGGQPAAGDAAELHGGRPSAWTTRRSSRRRRGLAPATVAEAFRNPRVQTWNVNVQRELSAQLQRDGRVLRLEGRPPARVTQPEPVRRPRLHDAPFPRLSASSPILPNSTLGNITEVTSLGYSRYKALWITANQRFSGGLQVNASYTLSESKDTNSLNSQGVVVQDSTNIAGDYALSDFNAKHRYVVSAIWELPFKGNRLVEGWQSRPHHPGPERQPDQHRHQPGTSAATSTSCGPTS